MSAAQVVPRIFDHLCRWSRTGDDGACLNRQDIRYSLETGTKSTTAINCVGFNDWLIRIATGKVDDTVCDGTVGVNNRQRIRRCD